MNSTIVYVSSNMEDPEFEHKVITNLVEQAGDAPIVSVTQKPTNLGTNICVGGIGVSGYNVCRQILMGCEAAKTPFIISAEADCLYSPDYFTFIPPRLDIPYRNTNIYVQKYKQDFVNKKSSSLFAQVVGREFYIKRLKELFGDGPMWDTTLKNWPKEIGRKLFDKFEYFETEYPCISFKTGKGMRKHSPSSTREVYTLPYWGQIKSLRRELETKRWN